jgi:hypothetical protein
MEERIMTNRNNRDISTAEIKRLIHTAFRLSAEETEEEFVFVLEEDDTLIWHRPKTKVLKDC